jgi:hypothetical protein
MEPFGMPQNQAQSGTDGGTTMPAGHPFSGRIEPGSGWGYVGAAYGLSLSILLAWVLVVTFRLREVRRRVDLKET